MKFGTRGRYAVTAMADLALRGPCGPVSLAAIAERQGLSQSYLEQLFAALKRHQLVRSVRGPGGGYTLAKPIERICIAEIVMAVDEPLHATMCQPGEASCRQDGVKCLTHDLWAELGQQIVFFLQAVTLKDVVENRISGMARTIKKPDASVAAE